MNDDKPKAGDLVRMKYISFFQKKNNRHGIPYTETPLLVYESAYNAIKVILPEGQIKHDLAEYYEVISRGE